MHLPAWYCGSTRRWAHTYVLSRSRPRLIGFSFTTPDASAIAQLLHQQVIAVHSIRVAPPPQTPRRWRFGWPGYSPLSPRRHLHQSQSSELQACIQTAPHFPPGVPSRRYSRGVDFRRSTMVEVSFPVQSAANISSLQGIPPRKLPAALQRDAAGPQPVPDAVAERHFPSAAASRDGLPSYWSTAASHRLKASILRIGKVVFAS